MQAVNLGMVAGVGLVKQVKFITFVSYWLIGIPFACVLMLKFKMGLIGLWCGPTLANIINYSFYEHSLRKADWQLAALKMKHKMK